MIEVADSAIKAASVVNACPGLTLDSGLQADPCTTCLRRSQHALIGPVLRPAARWVETNSRVGYECANHAPLQRS